MIAVPRVALATSTTIALLFAACGGGIGNDGPRKVEVNQQVCASQKFLRMRLDRTHRIEIDNSLTSPGQNNLVLRIEGAPLVVDGDVPEGSVISDPFSTIVLEARGDDEKVHVDVIPRRTGSFHVQCNWYVQGDANVSDLTLQIVQD